MLLVYLLQKTTFPLNISKFHTAKDDALFLLLIHKFFIINNNSNRICST